MNNKMSEFLKNVRKASVEKKIENKQPTFKENVIAGSKKKTNDYLWTDLLDLRCHAVT
jgi:hypothetical protein